MSFRKSLVWTAGGQLAYFPVQFAGSVVLARLLSPNDFGVNALAVAISGVLCILQSVRPSAYIVREADLTHDKVAVAATVYYAVSGAMAAVGNSTSPLASG